MPATTPHHFQSLPVREILVRVISGPDAGREIRSTDAVSIGTAANNTLVLEDRTVSRYHVELSRAGGRITVKDLGSTNGTRVGPAWVEGGEVAVDAPLTIDIGSTTLRLEDGVTAPGHDGALTEFGPIRGRSAGMRRVMRDVRTLAPKNASVLCVGESGTGKGLIASALHELSPRASGPFVTLDCGAISRSLFSSALLGHERGAFTGAHERHRGAFERAHGGTLLLDEIGELAPEQQVALLGVLERQRVQRVGSEVEVPVDVRVIAATHRDLRGAVNQGEFRLDLYYRLAVVTLALPPLRERPEDIPLIIERFLVEEGEVEAMARLFPQPTIEALQAHHWTGNVRELRNVVVAALAMDRPPELDPGDPRSAPSMSGGPAPWLELPYGEARKTLTRDFERRYLTRLLERSENNVRAAARLAKMNRSYLIELLDRHGLR